METTVTTKEKEYSNQIYSLLLYVSIFIILYNAYFCFEGYFLNSVGVGLRPVLDFVGKLSRALGVSRTFFTDHAASYLLLVLAMATAMVSRPKASTSASKATGNSMLLIGAVLIVGAAYLPLGGLGTGGFLTLTGLQALGLMAVINGGLIFGSMVIVPDVDVFNATNEQFPQFQQLLENDHSVNYKTLFQYGGKWREGYVNVLNPQRAVLVVGSQGSGKTFTVLNPAIWQSIYKGYAAVVYDVKFPDLTLEAYNALAKSLTNNKYAFGRKQDGDKGPILPQFALINFDEPGVSARCNPIGPEYIKNIDEASETAKLLLLNLNRTWISKEGDFFADSAINYLTLIMWYMRLVEKKYVARLGGKAICTLPHCIEFIAQNPNTVIDIVAGYPELDAYSAIFKVARENKAGEQLAGQVASCQNALARLASPNIYWTMTGNDIDLDVNNPRRPKVLCLANNPLRLTVYGAALSVYTSTIMRSIYKYKESGVKSAFFIDELPTMYLKGLDSFIATVRSYKVATWLGIQDMEQLTKDYGRDQAKVILNTCGTIFSGAVNSDSAETLSKMFGKTQQGTVSTSFQKSEVNVSESSRMEQLVPASKIATLSQGFFVGKVADNYGEEVSQKLFNGYVAVETDELKKTYKDLPRREVTEAQVEENFFAIKKDIVDLIRWEQDGELI
ncbi:type IV secretory system conjugative DNA transfer family protein [Persicitalea jodogahamensis]|uniref:Uncharacterized protein n=1 Tax=Persicitalea jodogahamensis TaxID=402147 RepID=A0A8J3DDK2_9BACT|nr:type IV secretory system conjugative DNA transfer family protein [Persicitalea jodogahamensis]GHB87361.1 hypothetical protein GCM10007390_49010 [Persicitalea jodogahamensis]